MFPMTMTIHNPAQLNAVLGALQLAAAEPTTAELAQIAVDRASTKEAAAPAPKPVKDAPARGPRTATVAADAAPEKTAEGSAQPAASAAAELPASTAAADPITYDQVAKAITDRVKTDRPAVLAALARFKVAKGPELKPAQYADFLAVLGG